MKKFLSLFLVSAILVICALSLASCSGDVTEGVPEGMKIASSEQADYYFYVPEGASWICDVASGATTAYYSNTDTSNVSVMDYILANTDYKVEDWWNSFENDFKNVYGDFEVVSSENVILDGVSALKTVFTGKMNVGIDSAGEPIVRDYKFMQISAIRSATLSAPKAYVFTYTSLNDDTFDSHLEDVETMIENFKFK